MTSQRAQHIIRPAHPLLDDVFRNADRRAILENMRQMIRRQVHERRQPGNAQHLVQMIVDIKNALKKCSPSLLRHKLFLSMGMSKERNHLLPRYFPIDRSKIIRHEGKDVRGDASLPKQFAGIRMTKNAASVGDFRDKFQRQYPGYTVDVLKGDGTKASGQTKLSTVRDTYLDEE